MAVGAPFVWVVALCRNVVFLTHGLLAHVLEALCHMLTLARFLLRHNNKHLLIKGRLSLLKHSAYKVVLVVKSTLFTKPVDK